MSQYVKSHFSKFPDLQFRELWSHNKVQYQISERLENRWFAMSESLLGINISCY